jgi:hypothetical protein
MSDRVYRKAELSDLPKIQSGTLKALFQSRNSEGKYLPAKLISTRWATARATAFLIEGTDFDFVAYIEDILVDTTPTYKYAIWNQKAQRFVLNHATNHCMMFDDEIRARTYLVEFQRAGNENDEFMKRYYVTKFEVPNE